MLALLSLGLTDERATVLGVVDSERSLSATSHQTLNEQLEVCERMPRIDRDCLMKHMTRDENFVEGALGSIEKGNDDYFNWLDGLQTGLLKSGGAFDKCTISPEPHSLRLWEPGGQAVIYAPQTAVPEAEPKVPGIEIMTLDTAKLTVAVKPVQLVHRHDLGIFKGTETAFATVIQADDKERSIKLEIPLASIEHIKGSPEHSLPVHLPSIRHPGKPKVGGHLGVAHCTAAGNAWKLSVRFWSMTALADDDRCAVLIVQGFPCLYEACLGEEYLGEPTLPSAEDPEEAQHTLEDRRTRHARVLKSLKGDPRSPKVGCEGPECKVDEVEEARRAQERAERLAHVSKARERGWTKKLLNERKHQILEQLQLAIDKSDQHVRMERLEEQTAVVNAMVQAVTIEAAANMAATGNARHRGWDNTGDVGNDQDSAYAGEVFLAHTDQHITTQLAGAGLPKDKQLKVQMAVSGIGCLFGIALTAASMGAGLAAMASCVALVGFATQAGIRALVRARGRKQAVYKGEDADDDFQNELSFTEQYLVELRRVLDSDIGLQSAIHRDLGDGKERKTDADVVVDAFDGTEKLGNIQRSPLTMRTLQHVGCLVSVMTAYVNGVHVGQVSDVVERQAAEERATARLKNAREHMAHALQLDQLSETDQILYQIVQHDKAVCTTMKCMRKSLDANSRKLDTLVREQTLLKAEQKQEFAGLRERMASLSRHLEQHARMMPPPKPARRSNSLPAHLGYETQTTR